MHLTVEQLGKVLHLTRHEPRRSAKRYLKDIGGEGSAEELDHVLEVAGKSKSAVAEADRLDRLRHHTLSAVEQGVVGQVAEMLAAVRVEMERQGLTQSELAAKCNLTQPALSAYLTGKKEPGIGNLAKLATALGCAWRLADLKR